MSSLPNFKHFTIFDENLATVHLERTKLTFNKPVYVGMCIHDLSKTLMYEFHYEYAKKKWKDLKLLFTDTDSLMYEIGTEDFFKDIAEDMEKMYDTSDYPREGHLSGIAVGKNKKVIGLMKDEAAGKIIQEFVGLRSKLYSYVMFSEKEEKKKCKGVTKSFVAKKITHEHYRECLFSRKESIRKMNVIRSRKHDIFSETIEKVALSCDDVKRFIREDEISAFIWGHWRIPKVSLSLN